MPIQSTPVEIVIATTPSGLDLTHEIRLIKPALLYADRVRLYSPLATLVLGVAASATADERERVRIMKEWAEALGEEGADAVQGLELVESLSRKKGKTPREFALMAKMRRALADGFKKMATKVDEILDQANAGELLPAMESGALIVEPLITEGDPGATSIRLARGVDAKADAYMEVLMGSFMEKLAETLKGSSAYPLFDDETGTLVEAGLREGHFVMNDPAGWRAREAAAATQYVGRLPTFPDADTAEILEIRAELRVPLIRFRAAMAEIGQTLTSRPFSQDVKEEITHVYRAQVSPALEELRELATENSSLRQLMRTTAQDPHVIGTGAAMLIGWQVWDINKLLAGGVSAVVALAKTAYQQLDNSKRIERHKFFFLYEADKRLTP